MNFLINILMLLCLKGAALENEEHFKYSTILDNENRVRLEWNVMLGDDEKSIRFKLSVMKNSSSVPIIGFGMSDRGEFNNADLVIFERRQGDNFELLDCHTNEQRQLIRDFRQSYILVSGRVRKKQVEIIFDRKINTCDKNDYLIETGTVHAVYFLFEPNGKFPDVNELLSGRFLIEKDASSFGMKQTQLIRSTIYENNDEDLNKKSYFDVTNTKIKLPSQHTTYWCKVYKLIDKFKDKHHIIAFEGLITNSSKGKFKI